MTLKVALTGGIGSGKSAVTAEFAKLGVPIIDADVIARDLLTNNKQVIHQTIEYFGVEVTSQPGEISRRKLRDRVFADVAAKQWLEQTLHPKILAAIREQAAEVQYPFYIVAIPLLVETGLQRLFEYVIVVDVPVELQRQRVMVRDNTTSAAVDAIIATQASQAERRHYADYVIDNSGDLADTHEQVQRIFTDLVRKY